MRLAILADGDDAALYGLDGTFAWGEARTFAALPAENFDLVIAVGDVPPPLPANDALFELAKRPGSGVLVVGDGGPIAQDLRDRRAEVRSAPRLTLAELERAAVVVLAGARGAFAVLAAGRVLVAPRAAPSFGLLAGIDHLAYDSDREAAAYADAAVSFPAACEPIAAMAALTAESRRASTVYGRLATLR